MSVLRCMNNIATGKVRVKTGRAARPAASMVLNFRFLSTMRTAIVLIFAVITVCRAQLTVDTP
jgi:hypothetical protein